LSGQVTPVLDQPDGLDRSIALRALEREPEWKARLERALLPNFQPRSRI
jgi:hypothetical protein